MGWCDGWLHRAAKALENVLSIVSSKNRFLSSWQHSRRVCCAGGAECCARVLRVAMIRWGLVVW